MSISFNRNRAQVFFEQLIGISTTEELKLKQNKDLFSNYALTSVDAVGLSSALRQDAVDFFYSGILSFSEGIDSIFERRFSWATIKLYYSVYYLTRASLAAKGIAILRCKSMYRIKAAVGEKPYNTNNKDYNTTHTGTLRHYKDLFSSSDLLLSNNIDGVDAYSWMMAAREIVNYRSQAFLEPDHLDIWDKFNSSLEDGSLNELLSCLETDHYVMCFQEEFAVVAIPIKRLQQTISDLGALGILPDLAEYRKAVAKSSIGYDQHSLTIFSEFFDG